MTATDRAIDLAKQDWLPLLCNHPNTLRWLFRVVPDEVIAADPVAKAGRDLLSYVLGRAGETTELPDDPERLADLARSDGVRELLLVAMVDGILLRASREAEDAITSFLKSQVRTAALQLSRDAADRALQITLDQYREGTVDFTAVFLFAGTLAEQDDALADARGAIALSLVDLYRSLGGGWYMPERAQ